MFCVFRISIRSIHKILETKFTTAENVAVVDRTVVEAVDQSSCDASGNLRLACAAPAEVVALGNWMQVHRSCDCGDDPWYREMGGVTADISWGGHSLRRTNRLR